MQSDSANGPVKMPGKQFIYSDCIRNMTNCADD